jgi:hypothetical protein
MFVMATAACWTAPAALAGPTWVLDRARSDVAPTTEPGVVKVESGVQTRLSLVADGTPPPILPLTAPVGIDVDETTGYVYITDSGGYMGGYDFGTMSCTGNDCGALIRIDPTNSHATLVAGPTPDPHDNYLPNPYGLLIRSSTEALIADPGRTAVVSVNLTTGMQTLFNEKSTGNTYPGGLRSPWDVARDPSGDILVVNTGNAAEPPDTTCVTPAPNGWCPNEFDIPVPANCQSSRGFVMRYDSNGQQEAIYCSTRFAKPRHAVVDANGTIFVTDPAADESDDDGGFGTLFQINPNAGTVEPLSGGNSFATVSGLDFSLDGTRLVTSDETLFPYGSGGCTGGCGGIVQVNPVGGDQAVLEMREANGYWIDPIDIAVDRDEEATPSFATDTTPLYLQPVARTDVADPTAASVTVTPVRSGSTVTLICAEAGCQDKSGRQLKRTFAVAAGQSALDVPLVPFEYATCSGKYRLSGSWCCPPKTKAKGKRCVRKGKGKKRAIGRDAVPAKCKKKPCGKPPIYNKARRYRLDIRSPGLFRSRFVDFSVTGAAFNEGVTNCATSSTQLDLVVPVGAVACPTP